MSAKRLWKAGQTAEYLGIHPNTLKRWAPDVLPFYRVGTRGDRHYDPVEVDLYLLRRRVQSRACPDCGYHYGQHGENCTVTESELRAAWGDK